MGLKIWVKIEFFLDAKILLSKTSKLECVVRMAVDSILPHAEFGPNGLRKKAPSFLFCGVKLSILDKNGHFQLKWSILTESAMNQHYADFKVIKLGHFPSLKSHLLPTQGQIFLNFRTDPKSPTGPS